jgi:hypothetical protein
MKFPTFSKLLGILRRGTGRFPLPIVFSTLTTVSLILCMDKGFDEDIILRYSLIAGLGFVLSLLVDLILEASRANNAKRILAYVGVLVGICLFGIYVIPADIDDARPPFWYGYFLLKFCLHLGIALTPILYTRDSKLLWQFNLNLFLRFVFSFINAAIVYVGLALALLSIDKLFDVGWYDEIYLDTWFICAFSIHPLLFLGGIARISELEASKDFPKPLHFSLKFVGLPLTALYLTIIYAYVAKIVFQWDWPNGWVAMPIFILAVISLLVYVLSIPLSRSESWSLHFHKWLFRLIFPLSIVLILALQVRLGDYGMTINRYLGIGLGIWLLGISLASLIRPKLHVGWIPATLLLATLASIYGGPFGAFGWSQRAQIERIETLAIELGVWKDEQLVPTDAATDPELTKQFESSLRYIYGNFGSAPLLPLLDNSFIQETESTRYSAYHMTRETMKYLNIDDDLNNNQSYYLGQNIILKR